MGTGRLRPPSQPMPAAGEDSGAHDPQPSALSVAPGCPFRGQRRWQTWPSVPRLTWGLRKSSNVLQGPLQMPNPALFSTMSLPGTRTPPATGISPLERQLLYPDSMKGVCVSVGVEGRRARLPCPGESTLFWLAHGLALGQRLSCGEPPCRDSPRACATGGEGLLGRRLFKASSSWLGPRWRQSCLLGSQLNS